MGYKASGEGTIVLKQCENLDEIIDVIMDAFSDICLENGPADKEIILGVAHNEKFDSDNANAILSKLNAITLSGEIRMEGEDGARWRYRFEQDCGKWVEESCFSVFERYDAEKDDYSVPAYVLVKEVLLPQAGIAYGLPVYYPQPAFGQGQHTEVIMAFTDREAAEKECIRKNAEVTEKAYETYRVIKTDIKI